MEATLRFAEQVAQSMIWKHQSSSDQHNLSKWSRFRQGKSIIRYCVSRHHQLPAKGARLCKPNQARDSALIRFAKHVYKQRTLSQLVNETGFRNSRISKFSTDQSEQEILKRLNYQTRKTIHIQLHFIWPFHILCGFLPISIQSRIAWWAKVEYIVWQPSEVSEQAVSESSWLNPRIILIILA